MKTCFKCQESKTLDHFYKHKAMGDGYLGKCKSCTKSDVIENRNGNRDYYLEYDRVRNKTEKRKECLKRTVNPEVLKNIKSKWSSSNKYKRNAQLKLARAVSMGELIRPEHCSICSKKDKIHGHHFDYSRPLDVIWVCPMCHGNIHRYERLKNQVS